jgi:phosphate-selective porin OprO/OprP
MNTNVWFGPRAIALLFIPFLWFPFAVSAADQDQDEKIRQLEKRIEQLEKLLNEKLTPPVPPPAPPVPPGTPAISATAPPSAGAGTDTPGAPKAAASISAGASGFAFRSADSNFVVRLRGLLQLDSRWYVDDGGIKDNDGFVLRRARPILEGTVFRDFDFRITPEFGGTSPTLRDAWLNYTYRNEVQLTVGKMKSPGGLERWQSVANLPFIERSLVANLWPIREVGILAHGELWANRDEAGSRLASPGLFDYALGAFNGTGDDRSSPNLDADGDTSVAGRLFAHPFLRSGIRSLELLGVGVAGTYENTEGLQALPADGGYDTEGQQEFFAYLTGTGLTPATANVIADGVHWRLGPQAYWYYGPFGLHGEYGISSQALRRDDGAVTRDRLSHQAWTITGSWLVTGENATFKVVAPKRQFDPKGGGFGALQLVARYSVLDIDNDAFPNFADPTESATRANAWTVGVNWYLNRHVRASLNFTQTDFTGGNAGPVTRQNENAFFTSARLSF